MDRREMLTYVGAAVGTASLGGCLSEYRDVAGDVGETTTDETTTGETTDATTEEPEDTTTEEPEDTTTDAETTETVSGESTVADASLEVTDSGCGGPTNEASVTFREAETAVGVTGTITGSDACHTATLGDASYDAGSGTLTLTVISEQEEGAEVCAQCITEIDYEVTVAFGGGLPATVEVVHEAMGETTTVATAESE